MSRLSTRAVCELARGLDGVTEKDHFGADAFIANGRIFATVWHAKNEVNLMLSRDLQRGFLEIDGEGFNTLDNSWGDHAINVELAFIDPAVFRRALAAAHANSGAKRRKPAVKKAPATKKKKPKPRKRPSSV